MEYKIVDVIATEEERQKISYIIKAVAVGRRAQLLGQTSRQKEVTK